MDNSVLQKKEKYIWKKNNFNSSFSSMKHCLEFISILGYRQARDLRQLLPSKRPSFPSLSVDWRSSWKVHRHYVSLHSLFCWQKCWVESWQGQLCFHFRCRPKWISKNYHHLGKKIPSDRGFFIEVYVFNIFLYKH